MPDDEDSPTPLILDIGSSTTRIGLAGEEFPETIIATEIARSGDFRFKQKVVPALDNLLEDFVKDPFYFGDAIHRVRDILNVERFMVTNNWTALERFLEHQFNLLAIEPQKTPMIFVLPVKGGVEFSERIQHLMFERFNVPKIFFIPSVQCVLYTLSTNSGVAVSLGDRHTVIQSILKGFESEIGPLDMDITGERITEHLESMISRFKVNIRLSLGELQGIKEKVALFVRDISEAMEMVEGGSTKFQYDITLPNGIKIIFDKERFLAVEPYFQPSLINSSAPPLSILIADAIKQWGIAQRPELVTNIILTGGGSIIPNIVERLDYELKKIFPKIEIQIIAPSGRENLEWIGASMLYSKGGVGEKWILNKNWEKKSGTREDTDNKSEEAEQ
ncbi:MAG: actin/actin family protein [Promethearchaeota archaeon CR_4]|nr:MAG: actin/actin family protein [Candidatus Lokiarchaeota archaeon CR_4]